MNTIYKLCGELLYYRLGDLFAISFNSSIISSSGIIDEVEPELLGSESGWVICYDDEVIEIYKLLDVLYYEELN